MRASHRHMAEFNVLNPSRGKVEEVIFHNVKTKVFESLPGERLSFSFSFSLSSNFNFCKENKKKLHGHTSLKQPRENQDARIKPYFI